MMWDAYFSHLWVWILYDTHWPWQMAITEVTGTKRMTHPDIFISFTFTQQTFHFSFISISNVLKNTDRKQDWTELLVQRTAGHAQIKNIRIDTFIKRTALEEYWGNTNYTTMKQIFRLNSETLWHYTSSLLWKNPFTMQLHLKFSYVNKTSHS